MKQIIESFDGEVVKKVDNENVIIICEDKKTCKNIKNLEKFKIFKSEFILISVLKQELNFDHNFL
jgi:hypothetical protein